MPTTEPPLEHIPYLLHAAAYRLSMTLAIYCFSEELVRSEEMEGNMEGVAVSGEGISLYGMRIGEICSRDIQVAINEGNRQRHSFFVIKMGKTGVAMPYQQVIPSDFARYHRTLHLEDITLEGPCGRSWAVTIRSDNVMRFGKGWRQFSVENHLREGYQLLFHLLGKSRFVVRFFDNLGKRHANFPPLTPMPAFVEPRSASRRGEEDASERPLSETPIATSPPPFETPVAKPPTRPTTPQAKTPALDSKSAKFILRQFITQVHPNLSADLPNSRAAVAIEDMAEHNFKASGVNDLGGMKTEHVGNQGSYEEQATVEGKAYILISDDDDELVKQDLPETFIRTTPKRDFLEGMDHKDDGGSYLEEQTGFHSPAMVRTPRRARNAMHLMPEERVEQGRYEVHQDDQDVEEGDHFAASKTCSDNTPLQYVESHRPVRKKPSLRRASWKGKGSHGLASFAKPDDHGHHGPIHDLYTEKTTTRNGYPHGFRADTSTRGILQRASRLKSHDSMSPAKLLLTQQGCTKYSEIISKRKRGYVTDEERQTPLTAATRFAAGLNNESFLVVLKDYQVYHGFQLPIPRDFLEATGTLKANKVKVSLIDSQKTLYEMKWKWHSSCQTPFLNCDGWASFALDHVLEEGDVCVFELIGPGPAILLAVHIFKVVENSARDHNPIREHRGSQSAPLNQKFGRQASAAKNAERELRHNDRGKKGPIVDLGRPSLQKTIQKPHNLQAWTKLFKPRVRAQFGGSRGQRQF